MERDEWPQHVWRQTWADDGSGQEEAEEDGFGVFGGNPKIQLKFYKIKLNPYAQTEGLHSWE